MGDLFAWAFLIVLSILALWLIWQILLDPYRTGLPYLGSSLAKAYLWHDYLVQGNFFVCFVILVPLASRLLIEPFGIDEGDAPSFTLLLYSWGCIGYWLYPKFAFYRHSLPSDISVNVTGPNLKTTLMRYHHLKTVGSKPLGAVLGGLFLYAIFIRDLDVILMDLTAILSRLLFALSLILVISLEFFTPTKLVIGGNGVNINGRFMAWENFRYWLWNPIPKQEHELLLVNPTMSRLWRIPLDAESRTAVEDALSHHLGRPHIPHLENE